MFIFNLNWLLEIQRSLVVLTLVTTTWSQTWTQIGLEVSLDCSELRALLNLWASYVLKAASNLYFLSAVYKYSYSGSNQSQSWNDIIHSEAVSQSTQGATKMLLNKCWHRLKHFLNLVSVQLNIIMSQEMPTLQETFMLWSESHGFVSWWSEKYNKKSNQRKMQFSIIIRC